MQLIFGYPLKVVVGMLRDTELTALEQQAERVVCIEKEAEIRLHLWNKQSKHTTKIVAGVYPTTCVGLTEAEIITMAAHNARVNVLLLDGDWTFPTSKSALDISFQKFKDVLDDTVRVVISYQSGRKQKEIGLAPAEQAWEHILNRFGVVKKIASGQSAPQHWAIYDVKK